MLQEATELSAHFAQVEAVFAEGDLQRIAATLDSIRQGLALVGDVPEFKGGAARLKVRAARISRGPGLDWHAYWKLSSLEVVIKQESCR